MSADDCRVGLSHKNSLEKHILPFLIIKLILTNNIIINLTANNEHFLKDSTARFREIWDKYRQVALV